MGTDGCIHAGAGATDPRTIVSRPGAVPQIHWGTVSLGFVLSFRVVSCPGVPGLTTWFIPPQYKVLEGGKKTGKIFHAPRGPTRRGQNSHERHVKMIP